MRRILTVAVAVSMLAGMAATASAEAVPDRRTPRLVEALETAGNADLIPVIVSVAGALDPSTVRGADRATTRSRLVARLRATAALTQGPLRGRLAVLAATGEVAAVQLFWVSNAIALRATPSVVEELASRPDVTSVDVDAEFLPASVEGNLVMVGAPGLWDLGYDGSGILVANLDSGVDASHPDLASRWRGGSNSWFDPYRSSTFPYDPTGHGTATMSIIVGGDAGGSSVGMAPGATWIAAKIFDDTGRAQASAIHAAFQWILDPDGNPATDDAPDVVNNSWTASSPGCDLSFQPDLSALRTAGILPVFAAGNSGPGDGTSLSPGNNPEAFSVGAVDPGAAVISMSSRGPSACTGDAVFPDLMAPGEAIRTAARLGGYQYLTGTSLAAPHVAGALALLLQARGELTADQQAQMLTEGAADLGPVGVDSTYGFGLLDTVASLSVAVDPPPVNEPPTAVISMSKRKAVYTFDGTASSDPEGGPLIYAWDFGDGATAGGPVVTHTFGSGTYVVTLTVVDDRGGTGQAQVTIGGSKGGGGKKGGR